MVAVVAATGGVIIAIVVVALAILGIGGFLLLSGGDDDDDDDVVAVDEDDDEETTTTTEADEETTTTEAEEEETTTTTAAEETTTTAAATKPPASHLHADHRRHRTSSSSRSPTPGPTSTGRRWTELANVQASTDLAAFRQLGASGVSYTLLEQQNADPDTTLDFLISEHVEQLRGAGAPGLRRHVFVGRLQELTNCGGQGVTLIVIVASNDAGQSVEVSTVIVPPDPVDEIEQHIIETFNIV